MSKERAVIRFSMGVRPLAAQPRPPRQRLRAVAAAACAVAAGLTAGAAGAAVPTAGGAAAGAAARASRLELPLAFEPNRGQTGGEARFLARAAGYTVWAGRGEAVLALRRSGGAARDASAAPGVPLVRLRWLGASPAPALEGREPQAGKSHYLLGGDPAGWVTDVPHFGRVRYRELWAGIDLELYGDGRSLEYDFIVGAGSDPARIEVAVEGAREIRLVPGGDLELVLAEGTLVQRRPRLYQESADGHRREVAGGFVLRAPGRYGFRVGAYDRSLPLVIDPVLDYATYLGGSAGDRVLGVAVGPAGEMFVAGGTLSANFPTAGAFQSTLAGSEDIFISKLNASGTALVYSTFLGGSGNERAEALAVDPAGMAIVAGFTGSTNFPVKNAHQGAFMGNADVVVAKLSASGSALEFSTYLGGTSYDWAYGVATDASGAAYVAGYTDSTNFPTASAFDATHNGDRDVFVAKLTGAGVLAYSTYLGGGGREEANDIAVGSSGHAFVTGYTFSANFPTAGPFQAAYAGSGDVFVAKLAPAGTSLAYSTYLGGTSEDTGFGIAVDASAQAFVVGQTFSTAFPTAGPFQAAKSTGYDAFVSKLNAAGNALVYSSYLGGAQGDYAYAVAVSPGGVAYVGGTTASSDFPLVQPHQGTYGGGQGDAFLVAVAALGNAVEYSTFLGGSAAEQGWAVAQSGGTVLLAGETASANFPVTSALMPTFGGGANDGFVARFAFAGSFPYRYWIPSASRASGLLGSLWRTDLGLLNPAAARADYELVYYAAAGPLSSTGFAAPASQAILKDVLAGLGGTGSGAVEVRSTLPLKVSSRTYNLIAAGATCTPNGTLGQNLDALEASAGLTAGQSAYLPQLTEDASFRTNISHTNMSTAAAAATVELFDGAGVKVGEYTVSLNPGQFKQEVQPFKNKAAQTNLSRGYARVTVTAGSGVVVYASVIDNITQDAATMTMQR
jgi:hypothetical protein